MRKFLFWLISLPLAILIAIFAVNNRTLVGISLWPTPFTVDMPVYLLILGSLGLGLLLGALLMWFGAVPLRVRLHNRDLEIRSLKRDLDRQTVEHQKLTEKLDRARTLPAAS